ncbi:hypothetical protein ACJIZ3_016348 [Penstemon smallii]|uniref:Uncharacterized protein n=1 Tax=Penstemon smallii TaxID=265156 RepID=A0ABD3RQ70_9LAMI
MMEVERKGTLIERLVHAEDRILKMCLQLEEEVESREHSTSSHDLAQEKKSSPIKKGLKKLVKSCVTGKGKHKNGTG